MDRDEARARIEQIQRIMERATLWTHLPGPAAVVGGLLVLVGCAVSYGMIRSLDLKVANRAWSELVTSPVRFTFLYRRRPWPAPAATLCRLSTALWETPVAV